MKSKNTQEAIRHFEEMLDRYMLELHKDPSSAFFQGAVKNTQEYIKELKDESDNETSK